MKTNEVRIKEIVGFLGNKVISVYGNVGDRIIDNLADAEHVNSNTLDWVNSSKNNKEQIAETSIANCIIVDDSVEYSNSAREKDKIYIVVKNPRDAMALVAGHFFIDKTPAGCHATAIIDPSANVKYGVEWTPISMKQAAIAWASMRFHLVGLKPSNFIWACM